MSHGSVFATGPQRIKANIRSSVNNSESEEDSDED